MSLQKLHGRVLWVSQDFHLSCPQHFFFFIFWGSGAEPHLKCYSLASHKSNHFPFHSQPPKQSQWGWGQTFFGVPTSLNTFGCLLLILVSCSSTHITCIISLIGYTPIQWHPEAVSAPWILKLNQRNHVNSLYWREKESKWLAGL